MKKALAIIAVALFIGSISVPVIAAANNTMTTITLQDEEPKKKAEEPKAEESKKATKSGDCSHEAKKPAKSTGGCEK